MHICEETLEKLFKDNQNLIAKEQTLNETNYTKAADLS